MNAVVNRAGFRTSLQDLGRTGFRQFGVSTSGALDSFALRVANLLVGNEEDAAGLEITLGGLQLQFEDERIVAWCGGELDVQAASRALPAGHVANVRRGDELKFGRARSGCRCWLAISGGIDAPVILRSRSTDLRTHFGGIEGRALLDGDQLSLGKFQRSDCRYRRYFLMGRPVRLGESRKEVSAFALHPWCRLGPVYHVSASMLHQGSFRCFSGFRSYGGPV